MRFLCGRGARAGEPTACPPIGAIASAIIVRSFNDKSNNAIRATYSPSAFKFSPFQSTNTLSLPIGNLSLGTVDSDPVLGSPDIQMSYVAVKLNGGATLPAHTHPRAAEMDYMVYGVLKNSFVEEFGSARAKVDVTLNAGEVGVIPEGLMHAQTCVAHEGCFFIAVLNSADPGTQLSQSSICQLDAMQVATSLGNGKSPSAATAFGPCTLFFAPTMS
ncbi:hypothetical protein BU14_0269s0007 [Porphyra umbilicalis]|uniref:Cupin type-1 domain-containing protein n=1 Tax=Porphyra umbilicalis TaxID=2786 RepID=A0A1X6P1N5_PORUM|nr:hypothetical protein BU14_0269s0007 [Porphyra umbilicalis]|eukprot:OSX74727.1 hypothetical protein BU14_0269s0007 [Porphyra umbilicalis]